MRGNILFLGKKIFEIPPFFQTRPGDLGKKVHACSLRFSALNIYHHSQNTRMAYLISRVRALYIDTLPLLSAFTDLWITILIFCETQTSIARGRNNFRLPLFKRNYGKQRLFYQCAKEWNILDASFKEINSLLLFKHNIKSCIF